MTWDRFGYICRKASTSTSTPELAKDRLHRIDHEAEADFYGGKFPKQSYPAFLLRQIAQLPTDEQANAALGLYARLTPGSLITEPTLYKRLLTYLLAITLLFLVIVCIYQFQVAPNLLSTFEAFGLPLSGEWQFYQQNWGYFVGVLTLLLLFAVLASLQLKRLFNFNVTETHGRFSLWLVSKNIRQTYRQVLSLLSFPITSNQTNPPITDPKLLHLIACQQDSMDVAVELQSLLRLEMAALHAHSEQQIKLMTTFIAVVVVGVIFMFIASVYSPLFILGESI